MSEKQLLAKKKDELIALCKEKGLPHTGTKAVLVERILGTAEQPKPRDPEYIPPVFKKMAGANSILVSKNKYGNYEYSANHLVFDKETHKVIGKQVGEFIEKLNREDIAFCDIRGLCYDASVSLGEKEDAGKIDIDAEMIKLVKEAEGVEDDESDPEAEEETL